MVFYAGKNHMRPLSVALAMPVQTGVLNVASGLLCDVCCSVFVSAWCRLCVI